ncbi:hypothetical protein SODALDRAFT_329892, partial [Sodiomyces alkalinus F11]
MFPVPITLRSHPNFSSSEVLFFYRLSIQYPLLLIPECHPPQKHGKKTEIITKSMPNASLQL